MRKKEGEVGKKRRDDGCRERDRGKKKEERSYCKGVQGRKQLTLGQVRRLAWLKKRAWYS